MSTRTKKEWFDDDAFWIETYQYMFPESRFTGTSEQIGKVLQLTEPEGMSALDLCCGPGRCAIALAQRGFRVTGVDRTPFFLDKARERAASTGVSIEWVEQDVRDFARPSEFDLVISMYTSFGYFEDKQDDILVLRNMFASMKPGGVCLIELMSKERLVKIMNLTTSEVIDDGTTIVQRHEVYDEWTRVRSEWILIKNGTAMRFKLHHNIYTGQELRDRLERVGFCEIKLYSSLSGEEYGLDPERLVIVGRKPG